MVRSFICLMFLSLSLFSGAMNVNKSSVGSYFLEKEVSPPQRDVSVIISREGYYPKTLVFFKGERVRLYVTTTLPEESCFSMPSKDIFLTVKSGKISEGILFFNRAGTYHFNCPMRKITGKIVVLDHIKKSYKNAKNSKTWFLKENRR